jgi:hypothetical protein
MQGLLLKLLPEVAKTLRVSLTNFKELKRQKNMIDSIAKIDVTSSLNSGQARKVLAEIFNHNPNFISFTKHAREYVVVTAWRV